MWEFKVGDIVLWPNGIEGRVCGVDHSDGTIMDEAGGWSDMVDADPIRRGDEL